jgi:hypothetical protein
VLVALNEGGRFNLINTESDGESIYYWNK